MRAVIADARSWADQGFDFRVSMNCAPPELWAARCCPSCTTSSTAPTSRRAGSSSRSPRTRSCPTPSGLGSGCWDCVPTTCRSPSTTTGPASPPWRTCVTYRCRSSRWTGRSSPPCAATPAAASSSTPPGRWRTRWACALVAEGVEDAATAAALVAMDIDMLQGSTCPGRCPGAAVAEWVRRLVEHTQQRPGLATRGVRPHESTARATGSRTTRRYLNAAVSGTVMPEPDPHRDQAVRVGCPPSLVVDGCRHVRVHRRAGRGPEVGRGGGAGERVHDKAHRRQQPSHPLVEDRGDGADLVLSQREQQTVVDGQTEPHPRPVTPGRTPMVAQSHVLVRSTPTAAALRGVDAPRRQGHVVQRLEAAPPGTRNLTVPTTSSRSLASATKTEFCSYGPYSSAAAGGCCRTTAGRCRPHSGGRTQAARRSGSKTSRRTVPDISSPSRPARRRRRTRG